MVKYTRVVMVALMVTATSVLSFGSMSVNAADNPFQPPGAHVAPTPSERVTLPSGLTVDMILKGADRRVVIIDGALLGVGDRVKGYLITAIEQDRVHLEREEERLELETSPGIGSIRVYKNSSNAAQSAD